MPVPPHETTVKDVPSLLRAIDEVYSAFSHQPWWRSHASEIWELVPGVHRFPERGPRYEANIAMKFAQRAPTRHSRCPRPGELARWLFLMQHYRLRTRLLDWSESPFVALYFAVAEDQYEGEPGVLWALDPFLMNEFQIGEPAIVQPGHEKVDPLISLAFSFQAEKPDAVLALFTEEVDLRMMVQLSMFTIHGSSQPLEGRADSDRYLLKFVVDAAAKRELRMHLERFGIRERNLFPDLDHLARDLNRDFYVDPTVA